MPFLQDIVTESLIFDLDSFLPLLRERISSKNSFARQFVIAWISVLNMVPNLNLTTHLPDILDGLFKILDDPIIEVKKMCEALLGEFLRTIKNDPSNVNFPGMINILIVHAQEKNDDLVQVKLMIYYIKLIFVSLIKTLQSNKPVFYLSLQEAMELFSQFFILDSLHTNICIKKLYEKI